MDIGKKLRRTTKKLSSGIDDIGKSFEKAGQKTWGAAKSGEVFGDSVWGMYLNNITGVTTSSRLVGRARNGEHVDAGDVVDDASVMRPSRGYSDAMNGPVKEMEMQQKEAAAAFERRRVAEEARARGQVAVRVRRGMRDSRSTKGGTIATSPLGLGGTGGYGDFARLLGL